MDRFLRFLEPLALCAVPCTLIVCALLEVTSTALLSLLTVLFSCVPFFARFERAHPRPRDLMPIAVVAAVAAAGRIAFAMVPNFQPATAILIVGGLCFGRQSGFLMGALCALASNLYFGQGAWTPWQMFAWGCAGYTASLLGEHGHLQSRLSCCVFGGVASLCYGLLMDSWHLLAYIRPITWQSALLTYAAGIPFNLLHAGATVVFLWLLGASYKRMLLRIRQKYGLM